LAHAKPARRHAALECSTQEKAVAIANAPLAAGDNAAMAIRVAIAKAKQRAQRRGTATGARE
jgi:uncharacterized protein YdaT